MTYYTETARPAMRDAATLMGEVANDYTSKVQGASGAMGQVTWPLMMFFCTEGYNTSLGFIRDAATDTGSAVQKVSTDLTTIVQIYDQLEEAAVVK